MLKKILFFIIIVTNFESVLASELEFDIYDHIPGSIYDVILQPSNVLAHNHWLEDIPRKTHNLEFKDGIDIKKCISELASIWGGGYWFVKMQNEKIAQFSLNSKTEAEEILKDYSYCVETVKRRPTAIEVENPLADGVEHPLLLSTLKKVHQQLLESYQLAFISWNEKKDYRDFHAYTFSKKEHMLSFVDFIKQQDDIYLADFNQIDINGLKVYVAIVGTSLEIHLLKLMEFRPLEKVWPVSTIFTSRLTSASRIAPNLKKMIESGKNPPILLITDSKPLLRKGIQELRKISGLKISIIIKEFLMVAVEGTHTAIKKVIELKEFSFISEDSETGNSSLSYSKNYNLHKKDRHAKLGPNYLNFFKNENLNDR